MPDRLGLLLRGRRLGRHDRLGLRLRLELGAHLGLASDVDAPPCQLGGEAGVLSLLADRERELLVRDHDVRGLVLGDDVHADHVRRLEGVRHVALRALRPLDDVDLLAAELVHDRLDAEAALPDARPARVEAGLPRAYRDLGARPGLAGDPDDLHLTVEDLRDLQLEQPLDQRLVCAAHDGLRTPEGPAYFEHYDLTSLSGEVAFMGRLLGARQDRGRAAVEIHVRRARFEVADLGVDDVALAIGVLGEDLLALRLAERLLDHLFRVLRADAAERGGGLLEWHDLAKLHVGLDALRGIELDLDLRIFDLLHDGLQQIDPEGAGLHVDLDVDVLLIAVRALDG